MSRAVWPFSTGRIRCSRGTRRSPIIWRSPWMPTSSVNPRASCSRRFWRAVRRSRTSRLPPSWLPIGTRRNLPVRRGGKAAKHPVQFSRGALGDQERSVSLGAAPHHGSHGPPESGLVSGVACQEVIDLHAAASGLVDGHGVRNQSRPVAVVIVIGKAALVVVDPAAILEIVQITQNLASGSKLQQLHLRLAGRGRDQFVVKVALEV